MKSADYWKKRSEQLANLQFDKADQYEASLRREYDRAMQNIQQSIEVFYQRYAINNEINLAETRRLLTGKELKEFKMTLEEFTAKAKDNADGRWTHLLNSVYYKTRISRLEALQLQIQQHVEILAADKQQGTHSLLADIYEDTYYRNIYELQKGTGFGVSFAKLNDAGIETALSAEYAGSNWSKRIWGDRDKLAGELRTKLTQSFIRGDSIDRTVRDLRERMGVSKSNAERLVQSESAFFAGQATMAGYKASGIVQKYEILATLDGKTSVVCRSMDGKVFPLSEMEVSVNYPPFHARCRTTTVAAFDDDMDPGERIARDTEGDAYFVPGDITYGQWMKTYGDGKPITRKNSPNSEKIPMDPEKLRHITEKFEEKGLGIIRTNQEAEDYLNMKSKMYGEFIEAASIGDVIYLRPEPTASAVFEEIIHNTQNRHGRMSTDYETRLRLEIEAAEKLIRHEKAYGIPQQETRQTMENLRIYKEELKKLLGEG